MKKVIILTFFLVTCFIQLVLAYEYEVVNLGAGEASDINEFEQIVGRRIISGAEHAVIWDVNRQVQDLGTLGGSSSHALDINNLGQVVGRSYMASGGQGAFLWDANNGIQSLSIPGATWRYANSINDNSEIVGTAWISAQYGGRGFKQDNIGNTQILGTSYTYANSINKTGQVVGSTQGTDGVGHAFFWDGEMQTIEIAQSAAYDINDSKVAVGKSRVEGNMYAPTIWDINSGSATVLGSLAEMYNGNANSINNAGLVVGRGANNKAFLWDSNNGERFLTDLIDPASGWILQNANAINEKGQIVGQGMYNGVSRAFLLNPTAVTPEPASMLLFGLGGLTMAVFKRKKKHS